jgi:hypothetical protein
LVYWFLNQHTLVKDNSKIIVFVLTLGNVVICQKHTKESYFHVGKRRGSCQHHQGMWPLWYNLLFLKLIPLHIPEGTLLSRKVFWWRRLDLMKHLKMVSVYQVLNNFWWSPTVEYKEPQAWA